VTPDGPDVKSQVRKLTVSQVFYLLHKLCSGVPSPLQFHMHDGFKQLDDEDESNHRDGCD
jgi:hypothetical protein